MTRISTFLGKPALPRAFFGMVLIIIAVEVGVSHLQSLLFKPDDWDWYLTGRFSRNRSRGDDVVFFGDSLVKTGVDPTVFRDQGISAFNLAMGGGQTPAAYYLLKRLVDRGKPPGAVVFSCHPKLLEEPPEHNLGHWPFLLSPEECLDFGIKERNARTCAQIFFTMLPSLRSRLELRSSVLRLLRLVPPTVSYGMPTARQIYEHFGHLPFDFRTRGTVDLDFWYEKYFDIKEFDITNLLYLDAFFGLADSKHIKVYWLITPVVPDMQAMCDREGLTGKFDRLVRRYKTKHPSVRILDFRRCGFPESLFHDPHHLNAKGAQAMSGRLLQVFSKADGAVRTGELADGKLGTRDSFLTR